MQVHGAGAICMYYMYMYICFFMYICYMYYMYMFICIWTFEHHPWEQK
jgi:hypothetical protein